MSHVNKKYLYESVCEPLSGNFWCKLSRTLQSRTYEPFDVSAHLYSLRMEGGAVLVAESLLEVMAVMMMMKRMKI